MRTGSARVAAVAAFLAAGALASPPIAAAHLVTTGLGPFYDGLGHLFLTPQDLLPLIALSLFAGLRGPGFGRAVLFALPVAWITGGLAGLSVSGEVVLPLVTVGSALVFGGLLAGDRALSPRVTIAAAVVFGLVHGFLNGTAMSEAGLGWTGLLGIACGGFVLVALLSGLAVSLGDGWRRIAVRVAGSWIVASGLLMLGWTLR